jgi:SAM-dependent methyltransferase
MGMDTNDILAVNRQYWEEDADAWFGVTALPEYGVQFVTEDELHLFGDVAGKRLIEIGCGSGHSLAYHAARGAEELWGIDISARQLEIAANHLRAGGHAANLVCAPMEADCGVPSGHFDIAYSIYAIGWTTDIADTLRRIFGYLRPGGTFIFSWRHPIHGCVKVEGETLAFRESYFDESPHPMSIDGCEVLLANRKMASYVNALAGAGFVIEKLIEQTDAQTMAAKGELSDRVRKAQMLPHSFVMKARRPI